MIIRNKKLGDSRALFTIVNEIVLRGGITAIEPPFAQEDFDAYFLGETLITLNVAENDAGEIIGFQALNTHDAFPPNVGDIATYVRLDQTHQGIGAKLFEATKSAAKAKGIVAMMAVIRADNHYGLGYYSKMDFLDCPPHSQMKLKDGRVIERVHKQFKLI